MIEQPTAIEEALDEAFNKKWPQRSTDKTERPEGTVALRHCRCGKTMQRSGLVWRCDCGYRRFA